MWLWLWAGVIFPLTFGWDQQRPLMKMFTDSGVGIHCPSGNKVYVHPITGDLTQCSQTLGFYNSTSCPGGTVCERFPILIPGFQDYCCSENSQEETSSTTSTTEDPSDEEFMRGRKVFPEVDQVDELPGDAGNAGMITGGISGMGGGMGGGMESEEDEGRPLPNPSGWAGKKKKITEPDTDYGGGNGESIRPFGGNNGGNEEKEEKKSSNGDEDEDNGDGWDNGEQEESAEVTTRRTKPPRSRKTTTTTTEPTTTLTTKKPLSRRLPRCNDDSNSPLIDYGNRLRDCYFQQCPREFRCEFNREIRRFICCGSESNAVPPPGLPPLPNPKPIVPRPFRPRPGGGPFGLQSDQDPVTMAPLLGEQNSAHAENNVRHKPPYGPSGPVSQFNCEKPSGPTCPGCPGCQSQASRQGGGVAGKQRPPYPRLPQPNGPNQGGNPHQGAFGRPNEPARPQGGEHGAHGGSHGGHQGGHHGGHQGGHHGHQGGHQGPRPRPQKPQQPYPQGGSQGGPHRPLTPIQGGPKRPNLPQPLPITGQPNVPRGNNNQNRGQVAIRKPPSGGNGSPGRPSTCPPGREYTLGGKAPNCVPPAIDSCPLSHNVCLPSSSLNHHVCCKV